MGLYVAFQLIALAILGSIQYYFYSRITSYLKIKAWPGRVRILVSCLFAFFNLLLVLALVFRSALQYIPEWTIALAVDPLYVWHFSFFVLFLVVAVGTALKAPFLLTRWVLKRFRKPRSVLERFEEAEGFRRFNAQRRSFVRHGVTILGGLTMGSSALGAMRRNDYDVTVMDVPVKGLPDAFEGFSVGFVSDIHSSVFMDEEEMSRYVSAVNELHADVVMVTGDFVNSMLEEVYPFAGAFSRLKAPHGVFGVLGNHDYYTRHVEEVAKEVNAAGVTLLRNEGTVLERRGRRLHLLGIDDIGTPTRAAQLMDRAMAGADEGDEKILLCHRPYFFKEAADRNIALTLSGHTHGGQIVFVRFGNDVIAPARIASPYVAGLYSIGSARMYVSRGIGTVGIPIRINCPPEVTKLILRKDTRG